MATISQKNASHQILAALVEQKGFESATPKPAIVMERRGHESTSGSLGIQVQCCQPIRINLLSV